MKKWNKAFSCLAAVCLALMVLLGGCGTNATQGHDSSTQRASAAAVTDSDKALHVSMLNVGQADATLIQYKGKNMLIDTGDVDSRDALVKQLKEKKVKTLILKKWI